VDEKTKREIWEVFKDKFLEEDITSPDELIIHRKLLRENEIVLPRKGETVAISFQDKTAALCYDRIWSTGHKDSFNEIVPKEIRCFGGTEPELEVCAALTYGKEVLEEIFSKEDSEMGDKVEKLTKKVSRAEAIHALEFFKKYLLPDIYTAPDIISRNISRAFSDKYKIPMIPVFSSEMERDRQYYEGKKEVVIASLANLDIVDEREVSWEQVLEFRADKENRDKYRKFIHWLDKEMVGKSQAFVEDEIAMRLEDYEKALKKHGIKTIVGTIQEALDGKYLLGASGITAGVALTGHPTLGLLTTGILVGGRVAVKIIQEELDFDDVEKGQNSEISWVYEAKKLKTYAPKRTETK